MTGTPEGSTESGFMEKPGIEPATPGLQGIALIQLHHGGFSNVLAFAKHTFSLSTHLFDQVYFDHRVQFHPSMRSSDNWADNSGQKS